MNLKEVINRFSLVSGLSQGEISKWVYVIIDCINYFESKMSGKTYCQTDIARLTHACAVYAYYKYSVYSKSLSSESFKAGDVQITSSGDCIDNVRAMWECEAKEISDLVDFSDFCFMRVIA